ncbi:aminotransferase class III-fold pyridoxal phosphate-dependent enzyme [Prochlorococcus sp. MIT 0604]|uniref:aminotransferase class III-fold pyridoxal phosphate-dependent enzyme n=1 Tax=Prochlorococcus sp. MIT 0604 TaxID=1501268 RepID=UPI0004F7873B|nr:aminotransferase class III-fold pyridoxal phosphate-dependent enzyme [Prochlorococcus sp. MIT 0604]AIQ95506.1 Glutamate-1-semialdehyde aminotransferase [Prochlorococcus sp. MIT 0604]
MNSKVITAAILQARMSSKRLPGKVLAKVVNKSILEFQIERIKNCDLIDEIIIATTVNSSDDVIEDLSKKLSLKIFRGHEDDVLARYAGAAKLTKAENIVRLTADCPLIDPEIIDEVINIFKTSNIDYASNTNPPTFPDGLDVEVFSKKVLFLANDLSKDPFEREHVTSWLIKNKDIRKKNLFNPEDFSNLRWTVDYPEDLELIVKIVKNFNMDSNFSWKDILNLEKKDKNIFQINQKYKRNEGSNISDGQKLWGRAKKVIPGGNMLLSKRPELFLPNGWPTYFSKTKGSKVWDISGKQYIDMSLMGVGTNILGYSNKYVDEAVKNNINLGNMSSFNCPEEVYLAEKLVEMHTWADMVRFARTGGEANAIAIRIARAATGRDKIAICGYHGWHDWYLATNHKEDKKLDEHLLPGLEPNGVPKCLKGTIYSFSYNNLDQLKKIIENNNLAAVKMEVERNIPPNPGFLEEVRRLCDENDIILIFDECTSGFRETYGGLHLKYNVFPDMAIFGKALGNGYAITSIIGKQQIMQAAQKTFISSTFWTERIGPTAALKVLEIMEKEKSWEKITKLGIYLREGWKKLAEENNLKINIFGIPALSSFQIVSNYSREYKTFITQEMLKVGYLAAKSCYLSTSHDELIIDSYLENLDSVFKKISFCEKNGNIYDYLNHPICHSGFKRLN